MAANAEPLVPLEGTLVTTPELRSAASRELSPLKPEPHVTTEPSVLIAANAEPLEMTCFTPDFSFAAPTLEFAME